MSGLRVRFAPSPTGHLHLGTARTALFNWLLARSSGGVLVLRTEDTDRERSTTAFEASLVADLRWLGLDWDEGEDVGGPYAPYRQSGRLEAYQQAGAELLRQGLAYRCFCSVERLEGERGTRRAAGQGWRYPGTCAGFSAPESARRAQAGEPFAVRLRVHRAEPIEVDDRLKGTVAFEAAAIEDFVLLRSTGVASYVFAGVLDDIAMRITDVVRGEDLLPTTPRQILLYRALGAEPPRFAHLAMVLGEDQAKLSKRHGAISIGEYRRDGFVADAIVNGLALLGWSDPEGREVMTRTELVRAFSIDRVSRSNSVFDRHKLRWLNGQHLRLLDGPALAMHGSPWLARAGWPIDQMDGAQRAWVGEVLRSGVEAVELLPELIERVAPVFAPLDPPTDAAQGVLAKETARPALAAIGDALTAAGADLHAALETAIARTGFGRAKLLQPLRAALTGATSGFELERLIALAERGSELFPGRIEAARERIERFDRRRIRPMTTIYGRRPVEVALAAGRRRVTRIWLLAGKSPGRDELAAVAALAGVPVQTASRADLSRRAGSTAHQGVVAEAVSLPSIRLETLLAEDQSAGLLVALDGVQDPNNLGAVLRSAACAGARAVIAPKDRAAGLTPAAIKVAEGAAERVPVIEVTNLRRALEQAKQAGLWCVGLDARGEASWDAVDLVRPTVLVLGSEGRGLRPLVSRTCDMRISIPVAAEMGSLNVAAAAAVGLYEVVRQRRRHGEPGRALAPKQRPC